MRLSLALAAGLATAATLAATASAGTSTRFQTAVQQILAQPYQPNYVPQGYDTAFGSDNVLNTAPAQDYTTGSIPDSPDAPKWPPWFKPVLFYSADGAPLLGELALHAGDAPGIVVVHGFNTHGYASVIRWAAMLYANGYDVLAADQRDFSFEHAAGFGYPKWQQTFGWKESEDVVAAGRYLAAQRGTKDIGLVGFSEGGQNTVLALALDAGRIFKSGIQFSGPADQNTQIYSTAVPTGCQTPLCTYPVTDALVQLVVPPYDNGDVCTALSRAATLYGTDGFGILSHETAFHAQTKVKVTLLNLYSADDSLVPAFEAQMMAGYEVGNSLQRTLEVTRGEHAYFFDRWWQERAILLYFKNTLASAAGSAKIATTPTVSQTAGGPAFGLQLVPISATKTSADALLAPYVCDTARGKPGSN
jgi:pimeloyl-ACP methyl ester carboxylesterase